jgi:hypothetical protein
MAVGKPLLVDWASKNRQRGGMGGLAQDVIGCFLESEELVGSSTVEQLRRIAAPRSPIEVWTVAPLAGALAWPCPQSSWADFGNGVGLRHPVNLRRIHKKKVMGEAEYLK